MSLIIFSFFYNRADEVRLSVSSVLRAAPNEARIVLVNDGSKDNTSQELHYFDSDNRVEVVDQENLGLTSSMANLIPVYLSRAKYEYLAIHGAGDVCHEDKFSAQLAYLVENPDVVALGCGHRLISSTSHVELSTVQGAIDANDAFLYNNVPFTHGTVVYRVDAFLSAGGYDAAFKCCQDWDLYFRLLSFGRLVRMKDVFYDKYLFEDGVSFNPRKKIEQIKFFKIVTSRKISESEFFRLRKSLLECGIDETIPTKDITRYCKRNQYSLIVNGEYRLALQWCDLIKSGFITSISQSSIRTILKILIYLKISKNIFGVFRK